MGPRMPDVQVRSGIDELAEASKYVADRVGHLKFPEGYDALVAATAVWVSVVAPRSRL